MKGDFIMSDKQEQERTNETPQEQALPENTAGLENNPEPLPPPEPKPPSPEPEPTPDDESSADAVPSPAPEPSSEEQEHTDQPLEPPNVGTPYRIFHSPQAFLLYSVLIFLAVVLGGFWILNPRPVTPVSVASSSVSSSEEEKADWKYPSYDVMGTINIDDFELSLNGSILLRSAHMPNGVTKGYLEQCLKLDPPAKFEVEELGYGEFKIKIEKGQTNPPTLLTLIAEKPAQDIKARIVPHLAARLETQNSKTGVQIDKPIFIQFSDQMEHMENVANYITISPYVDCDIVGTGNVVTVTPRTALEYRKEYTLTISNKFTGELPLHFDKDCILTFATEGRDFSFTMENQYANLFAPGHDITLQYEVTSEQKSGRDGTVALFAIEGPGTPFDAYASYLAGITTEDALTDNLRQLGDTVKQHFPDGLSQVTFPNPGIGYYLVRTTVMDVKTRQELTYYKPFSVATPNVYLQSSNGQTLLWLNDFVSGQSLGGYKISFYKSTLDTPQSTIITDSNGTVVSSLPENPYWRRDYDQTKEKAAELAKDQMFFALSTDSGRTEKMTESEAYERNAYPVIFVIRDPAGNPVYVDQLSALTENYGDRQRYYSCFYLDRSIYHPTDTINFWGFVKPYRMNTDPAPRNIVVTLETGAGELQSVTVPVMADGTYSGDLSFEKILSNSYEVRAEYTDPITNDVEKRQYLDSEYVEVREFQKPAYALSVETDRPVYRSGETVNVKIVPTFYDGTPLPDFQVDCSLINPRSGDLGAIQTVMTNSDGVATFSFKAGALLNEDPDRKSSWCPTTLAYYVKIASNGENLSYRGTYTYLPSDLMFRPTLTLDDEGKANLTVLANEITPDNIKTAADLADIEDTFYGYYWYSDSELDRFDIIKGAPVQNLQVPVKLTFEYAKPFDNTYDSQYNDYTTIERTVMLDIRNGRAVLEDFIDFPYRPETYLHIEAIILYQAPEEEITTRAFISNNYSRYSGKYFFGEEEEEDNTPEGYSLNVYLNDKNEPIQEYEKYLDRSYVKAATGDTLRFALCKYGRELIDPPGQMIYTIIQDEIVDRGSAANTFTITEGPQYARSMIVVAAYFDGKRVYPVTNCYVTMDMDSMELTLETTTDKETYFPGDQATVTVKVSDKNGNPVAASLCLSVVDEAIFAIREQYVDLLSRLYGDMGFYNYNIRKYTTLYGNLDPFSNGGDGGKGGGGQITAYDAFRKNFKDTAYFQTIHSSVSGIATATFKLPDNVTSWRITALAVGQNLYAGQNKSNFITTMPFFVQPVISSKYIVGDEISILMQGHGAALTEESKLDYKVRIQGDKLDETQIYQGNASRPVTVRFGKLPEGDYIITATGQLGQMKDTVQLPMSVISSNLELVVHKALDHKEPQIKALRFPVTISFYNQNYKPYFDSVSSLMTHYCFRIDQRSARITAKHALSRYMKPEEIPSYLATPDDLYRYQNGDGGIGWYVGGESDPIITFKALLVAKEQFSQDRLESYLRSVSNDSSYTLPQRAAALAALANVNPATLEKIYAQLEIETLTKLEKFYCGVGLALGGDQKGAKEFYEKEVLPIQNRDAGTLRLKTAKSLKEALLTASDDEELTALAWVMASKLGLQDDADAYASYFGRNNWRIATLFECMFYVENYNRKVVPTQPFSYTSGGSEHPVNLGYRGSETIVLSKSEMDDFALHNVPKDVTVMAYYIGEPEEADLKPSDTVKLEKTMTKLEDGRYENVLTVTLSKTASNGYYNISDWIPSNMRLYSVIRQPDNTPWVRNTQEGQKMYFEFYKNYDTPEKITIKYLTKQTYDTEAVVDRTYIVCADSGESAFTERSTIR